MVDLKLKSLLMVNLGRNHNWETTPIKVVCIFSTLMEK